MHASSDSLWCALKDLPHPPAFTPLPYCVSGCWHSPDSHRRRLSLQLEWDIFVRRTLGRSTCRIRGNSGGLPSRNESIIARLSLGPQSPIVSTEAVLTETDQLLFHAQAAPPGETSDYNEYVNTGNPTYRLPSTNRRNAAYRAQSLPRGSTARFCRSRRRTTMPDKPPESRPRAHTYARIHRVVLKTHGSLGHQAPEI